MRDLHKAGANKSTTKSVSGSVRCLVKHAPHFLRTQIVLVPSIVLIN